jgi:hypothetical protein
LAAWSYHVTICRQVESWFHDSSTVNMYPYPYPYPRLWSQMDNRRSEIGLTTQLNSTRFALPCLLTVGELVRSPIKMSDCEMQRINKPTIYNAFWTTYYAGYLPSRRKDSLDKVSKIASFTSSRLSSLGNDETSSEFKPKIVSLQNHVTLE